MSDDLLWFFVFDNWFKKNKTKFKTLSEMCITSVLYTIAIGVVIKLSDLKFV